MSIGKGLGYKRDDSSSLLHITPLLSCKGTAYALYESRVSSQSSRHTHFSVEVFHSFCLMLTGKRELSKSLYAFP